MKKIIMKIGCLTLFVLLLVGCSTASEALLTDQLGKQGLDDVDIMQQVPMPAGGDYVLVKRIDGEQEWLKLFQIYNEFPGRRQLSPHSNGLLIDPLISPGLSLSSHGPIEVDGLTETNWTLLGYSNAVASGTVEAALKSGVKLSGQIVDGTFVLPFSVPAKTAQGGQVELQELRVLTDGQVVETWPNTTTQ